MATPQNVQSEQNREKDHSNKQSDHLQGFDIHEHDIGLPHKIWFIPTEKRIVCLQIMFKDAGRKNINAIHPSLPSFLHSIVGKGAGSYDSQRVREIVYDSGAKIHFSMDQENGYFSLWAPAPSYREALDLGLLMITRPKLPQRDLEQLRKTLLIDHEESLKSPNTHLGEAWNAAFYVGKHPYRASLVAVKKDLQNLKIQDIRHYLRLWSQENAVVVVLGPKELEEEVVQYVRQALLTLPAKPDKEILTTWDSQLSSDTSDVHVEFSVPQSVVAIRIPGFDDKDPDFCTKKILFEVVCGHSMQSCLYQEIREKLGLAYYCYGRFVTDPHDPHIQILLGTQGASLDLAKKALRTAFSKVGQEGVPRSQFQNIKQEVVGRQVSWIDSSGRLVGYILSQRSRNWSLAQVQRYMSDLSQVTHEQVNECAKKIFKNISMRCVDVGQSSDPTGEVRRS